MEQGEEKERPSLLGVKCPILLQPIPAFVTLGFPVPLIYPLLAKWYIMPSCHATNHPINSYDVDLAPGPLFSSIPLLLCCPGSTLPSLPFWRFGCGGSQGDWLLPIFVILCTPKQGTMCSRLNAYFELFRLSW